LTILKRDLDHSFGFVIFCYFI